MTDSTMKSTSSVDINCDGNDIVINNDSYLSPDIKLKTIELNDNNNNNNNNKIINNKKLFIVGGGGGYQKTSTLNNNNNNNNNKKEPKKPKSVTASVFTQVKPNERNAILLNTNAQFNVTSRAQSVTASIFKPISQVSNILLTTKPNNNNNNNNSNNNNINNANNNISIDKNKNNIINNNSNNNNNITGIQNTVIPKVQILSSSPTNSSIDKRRSEDMNKGYISFAEDGDLTMFKEEPYDLTNLAPTAGDSCIPLHDSTPLFGEMLEGLILPDSYASLLPDEINSIDSQQSNNQNNCNNNNNNNNNNNKNGNTSIDPFINYRDDTSDTASSPHLLSPGGLSKSPEASSLPSLCSPHSLSQEDEFAFMTMNVEDDIDLSMRAPYIPMNEQDDLPLLTDDLMWSAFNEELSLHKDMKDVMQIPDITALKNQINQTNHNCYNNNISNNNSNDSNSSNINSNNNCLTTQLNTKAQSHNNIQQSQELQQSTPIIATSILQSVNNINLINSNNNNNNNNNNSNNNENANESSLVNLLCNNSNNDNNINNNSNNNNNDDNITLNKLQTDDDINCKKRKYIEDSLCDSIDAFGQAFNNKNCSNLDCWSVTDLLQLDQENIQFNEKSQNILISNLTNGIVSTPVTSNQTSPASIISTISPISTTATTTIHVPLITIQNNLKPNQLNNNNNKLNIQIKSENNCTKNITSLENLIINNDNNNNNNQNISNNINKSTITANRILNSCNNNNINTSQVNTVKLIPHSTIILNGSNINNNKRHIIAASTQLDSKRIKCNENSSLIAKTTGLTSSPITSMGNNIITSSSSLTRTQLNSNIQQHQNEKMMQNVEIQTTPHLLQQLISAPNPKLQKDNQRNQKNLSGTDKYYQNNKKDNDGLIINKTNNNHLEQLKLRQQQQHSPSNSVLKNLLVSGCDTTCPLPPLITDDENSQDTVNMNTDQMSPCTYYNRPYSCRNASAQLIRNCGANPMFGGPTMLPSPPIPDFFNTASKRVEISRASSLSSPNICGIENDMSNDSGIDDVGVNVKKSFKVTFDEMAFDLQKQFEVNDKSSTTMETELGGTNNKNYASKNELNTNIATTETLNESDPGGSFNSNNLVSYKANKPPPDVKNNVDYFKNQFGNHQSLKGSLSSLDSESMVIGNDENDVKTSPLIEESAGSFEPPFLMDFYYNMDANMNDDFLVDNWTNSLI